MVKKGKPTTKQASPQNITSKNLKTKKKRVTENYWKYEYISLNFYIYYTFVYSNVKWKKTCLITEASNSCYWGKHKRGRIMCNEWR